MKAALMVVSVIAALMCAGKLFAGQEQASDGKMKPPDVLAAFNYYVPSAGDGYKNGFGGEIQARFWLMEYFGVALAGGAASWEVKDESAFFYNGVAAVAAKISGDISTFPLGGSLIVRPIHVDRVSLTLEGGVRYVFVDSQVDYESAYADIFGRNEHYKDTFDVGNSVIGVVGANLEVKIFKPLFGFVGAGYQFDISKGAVTLPGATGSFDNELAAFYGKAGLGLAF